MTNPRVYPVLNRLVTTLYRSLPMYLKHASPWTREGDDKPIKALARIVETQEDLANRIANYVIDQYGPVELGEFPSDFPDTHDLSLDYLMGKLVLCQRDDVATIERFVAELSSDRHAQALAEEALGAARGQLEMLEELAAEYCKPSGWTR